MSTKYRTRDTLLIETTGVSIEWDLHVEFSVSRYRSATLTQPEEPRSVEIENVYLFICGTKTALPSWIENQIDNDEFKARLLEHAAEQDCVAAEDAAEAKRERQWEDAR